jgi:DUF2993 family protein
MFIFRRLLFMLAVPLLLFLGGSALIESFAESQLSNGMRTTLGLSERPTVQIEAFPIILRVIQGRIPRVRVDARTVVVEGLEIDRLSMDMEGVEASVDVLIRQNKFDLTVDRGNGTARITERAINAFLKREQVDVAVTLNEDGTVTAVTQKVVGGTRHTYAGVGTLSLDARVLIFKPTRFTLDGKPVPQAFRARVRRDTTFSVEIPRLPAGIVPREVLVKKGALSLVATFDGFVLKVR